MNHGCCQADYSDLDSFGIVALEIVCGRTNTSYRPKEDNFNLLDWALVLKEKGNLMELVDQTLGSNFNKKEVMVMIHIALQCTIVSPAVRPIMSSVVSMLESRTIDEGFRSDCLE
ncbi:probable LRR receptor-like serine/threonine-protein kinase At1g53430 [Actinidia eriantha]|uniref:probable LRR receptor-like serine/threonine-protein kinase At1g53430 n=1 Tax=Actinidia eriantha TaxID=165200 RepID=UPI0025830803|nr:probable LRR receptor-like serine/threonine-protein kinase At1g53430 [Actinidia eriantha]